MPLELSGWRLWALVGIVAALVIAIPIAFLIGRGTAPQPPAASSTTPTTQSPSVTTSGSATGSSPSASTRPPTTSQSASATSTAPPSTTSSSGASASGRPGDSVLAASGTGPSTARFTPSSDSWTLRATFDCVAGSTFTLDITKQDGSSAAAVSGNGRGEDTRTIDGSGAFSLIIGGQCRWTVSATG